MMVEPPLLVGGLHTIVMLRSFTAKAVSKLIVGSFGKVGVSVRTLIEIGKPRPFVF